MNAEELGRRIRAARAYAGLSTGEVAERVGMGRSTLERTEHGLRKTKQWELWGIAEVTGVGRAFFEGEELNLSEDGIEGASKEVADRLSQELDDVLPKDDEQDQQEPRESPRRREAS